MFGSQEPPSAQTATVTPPLSAARGALTPTPHFITLNALMGVFKANAGYPGSIINSEVFL